MAVTELDMVLPPLTYQGYLPNKRNSVMNSVTYLDAIYLPRSEAVTVGILLLIMGKEYRLWEAGR